MSKKEQCEINDLRVLEALYKKSGDGVLIADPKTKKFIYANPKICKWLGYRKKELLKLGIIDIHKKKDLKKVLKEFSEMYKEKKKLIKGLVLIGKDGSEKYFDVTGQKINIKGKDVVISFFYDITERKKTEDELLRNKDKYQQLFDNQVNGMAYHKMVFNKKGEPVDYIFLEVNSAFEKLTGLKAKNIIGKKASKIIPGIRKDPADFIGRYGKVAKNGKPISFELYGAGLGRYYFINVYSPKKDYFATSFQDITERKKAEEDLKISEEKFRDMAKFPEENKSPVIRVSRKFTLLSANSATFKKLKKWNWEIGKKAPIQIVERLEQCISHKKNRINEIAYDGKIFSFDVVLPKKTDYINLYGFDITENKKAEDELIASEEMFANLFKSVTFGVVYENSKGEITSANAAAERILGINIRQMQGRLSVDPRWKSIHEDGSPFPGQDHPISIALKTGKIIQGVIQGIYHPRKKDYVWINVSAIPEFKKSEKKPFRAYAIFEDITDKKKVEAELKINEERYKKAQAMGHVGSWEYNPVTTKFWTSDEGKRIYGFSLSDLSFSTEKVEKCIPERERVHQALVDLLGNNKKYDLEFNIITHNKGVRKTIRSIASMERDKKGKPLRVVGVIEDITERKNAENKLKESEIRYRRLFESAKDSILILDSERGEIIDSNPFVQDLLGYSAKELIGKKVWEISPLKDIIGNKSKLKELQKLKYIRYEDLPLESKSGKIRHVEFVANVYPVGGIDVIQCDIRDISERKEAQDKLLATMKKLKELDKLKDEFLNVATHELKTPLIPIKTQIELLLAGDYGELSEEQKEALEMVARNEEKLNNLVSDVLDVAKIKSKKIVIFKEKINLKNFISNSIEDARLLARNKEIKITYKRPSALPVLMVDEKRLAQVMGNLFGNAIKFTPRRGVIKCEVKKVRGGVVVSIEDNGIGMTKESLSKLFTPFFQVDSSASREYGGTGLGLSICKGIIEAHGGRIGAKSPGLKRGSTLFFSLPINK